MTEVPSPARAAERWRHRRPTRREGVASVEVTVEGTPATVIWADGKAPWVLDPVAAALWPFLDGTVELVELADDLEAVGVAEADVALALAAAAVADLDDVGALVDDGAPPLGVGKRATGPRPAAGGSAGLSWVRADAARARRGGRVADATVPRTRPVTAPMAGTLQIDGVVVPVASHASTVRTWLDANGALRETPSGARPYQLDELTGGGGFVVIDDDGVERAWAPTAELALGWLVAAVVTDAVTTGNDSILDWGPGWVVPGDDGLVVLLDPLRGARLEATAKALALELDARHHQPIRVVDVADTTVWCPDPAAVLAAVGEGGVIDATVALADRRALGGFVVDAPVSDVAEQVVRLAARWVATRPAAEPGGWAATRAAALRAAVRTVARCRVVEASSTRGVRPAADLATDAGRRLADWVAGVGTVDQVSRSAKVAAGALTVDRELIWFTLDGPGAPGTTREVVTALAELGLDDATARWAAEAAPGRRCVVGQDGADPAGADRHKFYVEGPDVAWWRRFVDAHPDLVTSLDLPEGCTPSFVAWKWVAGSAEAPRVAVYLDVYSTSAEVTAAAAALLADVAPDASDAILSGPWGFAAGPAAAPPSLRLHEQGGRRAVYLTLAPTPVCGLDVQGALRRIGAAAGLARTDADRLVDALAEERIETLIVGVTDRAEATVTIYGGGRR